MPETVNQVPSDSVDKKESAKKKSNIKKYIMYVALMLAVTGLAVYYVLKDDPQAIITVLAEAKVSFVFVMCALAIVCFLLEGATLTVLTKMYKRQYHLYQGVLNGLIGSFFSAITPFSSGGQFVQAFTFSKQGVQPADSASILVMLFIVSQSSVVLYNIAAFIFGYKDTIASMIDVSFDIGSWHMVFSPIWLAFIGLGVNVFSLAMLLFLSYSKPFHRFVLNTVIGIGAKLHLIKDPAKKKASLAAQVATFRIEVSRLLRNWPILLISLLLETGKWTFFNMSPYFAGLALGVDMSGKFMASLWDSAFATMLTTFVPTPGGSGGAEYAFYLLFTRLYGSDSMTSAANILNRSITFYLVLFIGFFVFVSYRGSPKKNITNYNGRETFVELQIVSLARNLAENGDTSIEEPVLKPVEETEVLSQPVVNPKKKIPWWRRTHLRQAQALKEDSLYMTPEQVDSSFRSIKDTLIFSQKSIYEEDSPIIQESKEELKQAYMDAYRLEGDANSNRSETEDLQIEKAIKDDLEDLRKRQEKKDRRKKEREEKRVARKHKADEKKAAENKTENSEKGE